ncbi:ankyrin [Aspergillus sclerotiicarbonarius CBS 121057]|uniref:Ankyrin n=1 Tax=Aspergillus sclerotiicarbonarius (strain CBS 121057 / IBT 28362) TaxID=1448318 RepID=A0A319EE67_ASPSB|nr:ankyrin [Aspergillus sclerotiicarbonarius CBS 121057]
MSLALLTPELILIIAGFLTRKKDLNSLARTSHYLYQWVNPCLYKHGVRTRVNRLLYWAASEGRLETLKKLLDAGARLPALKGCAQEKASRQMDRGHPISTAGQRGHIHIVEFLLSLGTDIDRPSSRHGRTPLHLAIPGWHFPLIQWLMERGADPARVDNDGCGPLDSSTICRNLAIFEFLLSQMQKLKGTAEYQQQLGDALCSAVRAQSKEIIESLLHNGAQINHIYRDGAQTALHNAVRIGNKELTRLLLDHGADPMIEVDRWDGQLLVCAAWRGHHAIVYMLVKRYPQLERQFADAMFEAARWGQESMTNFFLAKGVDPDHIRNGSRTALSLAGQHGHAGTAKVLLAAGADITATDANGRTPIWYAMQTRHKAVRIVYYQHSPADFKPYEDMQPDVNFIPEELPNVWDIE